jgi:hypothetical protein
MGLFVACMDDTRVWATQMGQIMDRVLIGLTLWDDKGQRVYCDSLTVRSLTDCSLSPGYMQLLFKSFVAFVLFRMSL